MATTGSTVTAGYTTAGKPTTEGRPTMARTQTTAATARTMEKPVEETSTAVGKVLVAIGETLAIADTLGAKQQW